MTQTVILGMDDLTLTAYLDRIVTTREKRDNATRTDQKYAGGADSLHTIQDKYMVGRSDEKKVCVMNGTSTMSLPAEKPSSSSAYEILCRLRRSNIFGPHYKISESMQESLEFDSSTQERIRLFLEERSAKKAVLPMKSNVAIRNPVRERECKRDDEVEAFPKMSRPNRGSPRRIYANRRNEMFRPIVSRNRGQPRSPQKVSRIDFYMNMPIERAMEA